MARHRRLLVLLALAAGLLPAAGARAADGSVKVVVAVLPFQVHSAGDLDYLENSLVDLLASRLEASGHVTVVQSVVVREAMVEHAAGERTEDALRRLAQGVGADYVVAGSLTELAGRFSLDVRVTPVTTAYSSDTMVFTAENQDELLDRVNELSERVIGIVTAAPTVLVSGVEIVGAEVAPDVHDKLRTRKGEPYSSAAVREDLATLRALPGVATATVETDRQPQGVAVSFRVVGSAELMPESPEAAAPGEDKVGEVRVRGNRRIESDAILARISTRAGGPYHPAQVAQDVREVFALGFFRNVRVLSEDSPDGRILTFEVEENPVIRQVTITGNEKLDADKIRDNLTLTTGATLDYPLLFENNARIEGLYRAEGFYLAKVTHEIENLSGNAVAVHFEVVEGDKLKLREIEFEGNEALSDSELRRGMKTKPWHFWSYATRYLDNSGTYSEPVFLQDLRGVEQKYTDRGYLQVEIGDPQVDPVDNGLVVKVDIVEGLKFDVGKIDVVGDETADVDALRESLSLHPGDTFDRSALTKDVDTLTHHYTDRGFYFASVNPRTRVDQDARTVDVTYDVQKGPLYFVRQIEFEGNTTTIDPVLRREMQLVEGQLYSARALQRSQSRIQGLQFFDEVNFEPKPTDYDDQIDVDVKVVERATGSLSFGAGFSSQESFVLTGSLSQSNLFGRGYGVQLSADIGGQTQRYYASFSDPYLFGSKWSFGATIFSTQVKFEDFDQDQQGVDLVFGHELNVDNTTRGFVRYSYAARNIVEQSSFNAASLIFRQIVGTDESTSLLGLTIRGDTRNDRTAPTEGGQWALSADVAGLGAFSRFVRMEGRYQRYFPAPDWFPIFPGRSTFMVAGRAGYALPLNSISDYDSPFVSAAVVANTDPTNLRPLGNIDTKLTLPLSERYFLGGLGAYQLRGYKARSVGPRRAVLRPNNVFGTVLPDELAGGGAGNLFLPVGREVLLGPDNKLAAICADDNNNVSLQGNLNGKCNSLDDQKNSDFEDLDETDVIGGNKFISLTGEYHFPISETLGLMGIVFFDMGNAFSEKDQIWDVANWRYGTGLGVLWFSPFGPLQAFWGVPLNKLSVEDSNVFEFSVGGANF